MESAIEDGVENLKDFLDEAELQQYFELFRDILKVTKLSQLKFVANEDLSQIGLSKPEQRRYKKIYTKYFPNPYITKIKKLLSSNKKNDLYAPGHSSMPNDVLSFTENNVKVPTKHIISIEDITINKELGMGQFGVVQQGTWTTGNQRLQVAIKCLGHERMTSNSTEFLKEAAVMHSIEHPNIVRLYGVVLHLDSLMLVTELAPLRSLLECLREVSLRTNFLVPNLCDFAEQICDGMTYLENKRLIHRDLAARNILVFNKDRVKISDFGLSRALGVGKDYYQTNYNVNLKLPVAWCAPECILYLRFTSASDVWAFGVCLWEMFTYGFQPWAAFSGQQILEAIDAPNFQRLERPECCPEMYYAAMLECWSHDPSNRPKFKDLGPKLRDIKPEQVQTTRTYEKQQEGRRNNFLEYKIGQTITVLGKESMTKSSMWYGVLPGGACGIFDPSHTKPYAKSEPPRQVVTPYKPSEDLEQMPLINPNSPSHLTGASGTSPYPLLTRSAAEMKSGCDDVDLSCTYDEAKRKPANKVVSEPTTSKGILNKVKCATLRRHCKSEDGIGSAKSDEIHEYHEISDTDTESIAADSAKTDNFTLPESPKYSADFTQSLIDEMEYMFRNHGRRSEDVLSKPSDGSLRSQTLNKSHKKKPFHTGTMKPMSAHDEKTLDTAVALANEITTRSMHDLDGEYRQSPQSPGGKFHFKFPLSLHQGHHDLEKDANGRQERRNFSEEANSVPDIQSTLTEEYKLAYASLIEQPTASSSLISQLAKDANEIQRPMTIPKPTPRTGPANTQFHSLQKNLASKRNSKDANCQDDDTEDGQNKLPLPPKSTKPKLIDKPRHVRKYPLKVPPRTESSRNGVASGPPIIYQNTSPLKCQEQAMRVHMPTMARGIDVYDGPTNPFASAGPSGVNPFSAYLDVTDSAEPELSPQTTDIQYFEEGSLVKDCTDHVSVEDLLEFADQKPCGRQRGLESDEVRVMEKVLKDQVTAEECLETLELCEWNVHLAIKTVRVRTAVGGSPSLAHCYAELTAAAGDVVKAAAQLVLTKQNNQ